MSATYLSDFILDVIVDSTGQTTVTYGIHNDVAITFGARLDKQLGTCTEMYKDNGRHNEYLTFDICKVCSCR